MKAEALAWLKSLTEKDLYPLLQELLYAMGYKRVTITHGPLECGRDLVFMEIDKLGREIWLGIQVKAGGVGGSLTSEGSLRSIVNQCEAAIDTPFTLPSGESVFLKEVWLVCTLPLTEQAKISVSGKMRNRPPLEIIDGQHLAELLVVHLPSLMQIKSRPVEKYLEYLLQFCDSVDEYIRIRLASKFSLHDVYVEQDVQVRLLPQAVARELKALDAEIGIDFIINNSAMLAFLGRNRYLPAVLHLKLTDMLTRMESVLIAAASLRWPLVSLIESGVLEAMSEILGVEPFGGGNRPLTSSDYRYECLVTADLLRKVEQDLVATIQSEAEVFPKMSALIDHTFPKGLEGSSNPYARFARDQFTHTLDLYYRSAIDPTSENAQVSLLLGRLIASRKEVLPINGNILDDDAAKLERFARACAAALGSCHESFVQSSRAAISLSRSRAANPM